MSYVKGILQEELDRLESLYQKYDEKVSSLPRGSLSVKKRNNKEYLYLAYREKSKVKFKYIGPKPSDRSKEIIENFKFQMKHKGISIWLPEPEAFILQKILISHRWKSGLKKEKDLDTAKKIGELCMKSQPRRDRMKMIFNSFPPKWRNKILKAVKNLSPELSSHLDSQIE